MGLLLLLLLVPTVLALLTAPVHAHTDLLASRPAAGERLDQPPTHVVLEFAQPIRVDTQSIRVIDPRGALRTRSVLLSHTERTVSIVLAPETGTDPAVGSWTVDYRVQGDDGHPISGRLDFGVDIDADRVSAPLGTVPAAAGALAALVLVALVLRTWARVGDEESR